jgi:hypothetical protein
MSKKKDRIKLPKRFAGVKIPKEARSGINRMLKGLPAPAAKPLLASAVTALIGTLATRLEEPLRELIEAKTGKGKARLDRTEGSTTAH